MNLKTTFVLIVLLGASLGAWFWFNRAQVEAAPSPTLAFLDHSLDPSHLTRIEVQRGSEPRFTLERTGEEWSLPGKWPVREVELKQWLDEFTHLRSRFAALPLRKDKEGRKQYGLDDQPLTIKITAEGKTHTLTFGEEPAENNRFTRATYLHLDDQPEVVRLGSGVLNALDRTQDYFLQRRIFPIERVVKEDTSKVEQLAAKEIDVGTPSTKFKLRHNSKDKNWVIQEIDKKEGKDWQRVAGPDRVDPSKLQTLLTSVPDLWAEKFVDRKDKKLADFGLSPPDYTLTVVRPNGAKSKLLIGNVSDKKIRLVTKPAPPPQFGPPTKPPTQMVTEEYRFAKLEDNDQIFEVRAEKLSDIAVAPESLRDPHLAHFKPGDVNRLEVRHGEQDLVFIKNKERWQFEKPVKQDAETKPIEELLDKLAGLQAKDKEILDKEDLKTVGLDKPSAQIKITVEEEKDKKKKSRTLVFDLGTSAKEKDKVYVRVEPWPRVNLVSDEVWKLVQRPVLAYRNRRVLDLNVGDLRKIDIQRDGENFAFEKQADGWKLATPVQADIDPAKVNHLASDLGKLESVEYVSAVPKAEDLEKTYGLAKPSLSVKLYAKKTPESLAVGKQRAGKQEYYARLDQGPVFTIKKELHDELDRSSLSYRSLQIWQLDPLTITEIAVSKNGADYRLKKEGMRWKIQGPFSAEAMELEADEMANTLARLKCERYAAHQAKEPAKFGLDKPSLKVQFTTGDGKQRSVTVGKAADNDASQHYAQVSDQEAVVVLSAKTVAPFNRDALDLLDKVLLSLNPRGIQRIRVQGSSSFVLEPAKDHWQVVDSPAPTFLADEESVTKMMRPLSQLRAEKFAAYGNKIDWAKYGLDKPATTINLVMKNDDKEKKGKDHVLELGKIVGSGERYARLDKKDAVVLLAARTAAELDRTYLDFLDPQVLKYDADSLSGVQRQMKGGDLELVKQEDQWRFLKPSARDADNLTVGDLLERTFRLRAKRIAAYPAKDLKAFGLDAPLAVVTLQLDAAGTMKKHVIKIGNLTKDAARKDTDERYALIDDRPTVAVLSAELSRHLTAPVLFFADRNLASFSGVDQAILQRGTRQATFAHPEATWQMVAPVKAEAEDAALDDLIRAMQRLRVDEIVADKGADLKQYGLDVPVLQWRFRAGDKEKMNLLVGAAQDKTGTRRYAKLAGKEEVFLLSAKLTAKVTEEYRSRKPWPNLDAAQVERVTITSGDKVFTLQKKDAVWRIAGEPDKTVDARKISDTLDALASLKVLKYVADAKADLQLYGLKTPAWKIDVEAPTGKRTLWLGRAEGDSQRLYASVAGSDAVFVIDETAALRMARPMSAFIESEKKK